MEKFNSYKYEQRAGEGNVRQLDVTSTRPVICGSYDTTGVRIMSSNRIFVAGTGLLGEPLIRDASSRGNKVTVLEENLRKAGKLARLKGVRSIHIPEFSLDELLIIAVTRDEEHFHPAAIDAIEAGDLVTSYVVFQPSVNSSLLTMLECDHA